MVKVYSWLKKWYCPSNCKTFDNPLDIVLEHLKNQSNIITNITLLKINKLTYPIALNTYGLSISWINSYT